MLTFFQLLVIASEGFLLLLFVLLLSLFVFSLANPLLLLTFKLAFKVLTLIGRLLFFLHGRLGLFGGFFLSFELLFFLLHVQQLMFIIIAMIKDFN